MKASVFFRERPERFGIAPFSSMFAYGKNSARKPADYRHEVHDSDGLLIEDKDGRRYWRPLENEPERAIRESTFDVGTLRGFGLRQRELDYKSYADLDDLYHRRPGVWVEPGAGWPAGSVRLFELPTGEEDWDNIVTYWQPARIPGPGESLKYEYTIDWALDPDFGDPLARVIAAHLAGTMRLGQPDRQPGVARYLVDFGAIPGEAENAPPPSLGTEVYGGAQLVAANLIKNPGTHGLRAVIDVRIPANGADYGLRARLLRDGREVSEIWDARPVPPKPAPVAAKPTTAAATPTAK